MSYKTNRAYGDLFIPMVGPIVGGIYGRRFVKPASYELDVKQATDLIMLKGPNSLGVRIRGEEFLPYLDFTIRSRLERGTETEFSKVMAGFMDWFFYGWGNGGPDRFPEDPRLLRWVLIDMELFRAIMRTRSEPLIERDNKDGTWFYPFPLARYGEALIAASEDPGLVLGWPRELLRAYRRLITRHPDGVETDLLRSHFIYGVAHEPNAPTPRYTPRQWIKAFEQTLAPFAASGEITTKPSIQHPLIMPTQGAHPNG